MVNNNAKPEGKKRDELIEEYFSLGDKFRKQVHRAFLSVDLAGATKMKVDEDALATITTRLSDGTLRLVRST